MMLVALDRLARLAGRLVGPKSIDITQDLYVRLGQDWGKPSVLRYSHTDQFGQDIWYGAEELSEQEAEQILSAILAEVDPVLRGDVVVERWCR